MKKTILKLASILSIASLSAFTLASCGGNTGNMHLNDDYKNELSKGDKVSSISFDVLDELGRDVTIDIKATDSYQSVMDQLTYNGYDYIYKSKDLVSYYAKTSDSYQIKASNYIYKTVKNTTFYDDSFFIGNIIAKTESFLKRGAYNNCSVSDMKIEYATNYTDEYLDLEPIDEAYEKANKAIYINEQYEEPKQYLKAYNNRRTCETNQQITFSVNNLVLSNGPQANAYRLPYVSPNIEETSAAFFFKDMELIDEKYHKYYDYKASFEITSNYLILKQKFNTFTDFWYQIFTEGLTDLSLDEWSKKYADCLKKSYLDFEVWIDYKNISESLGYSYIKVDNRDYQTIYSESNPDYMDTSVTYEAYPINITKEEIESKKQSFIKECSDNNILSKYNFN